MASKETALDINETNLLRKKLGLKPLYTDENVEFGDKRQARSDANTDDDAQVRSTRKRRDKKGSDYKQDDETTSPVEPLSISEPTGTKKGTSNDPILVDGTVHKPESVSERLERIKRDRIRKESISGAGIAEYIKRGKGIVDSDDEIDPLNIIAWANKMGNKIRRNNVTYSDDEDEPYPADGSSNLDAQGHGRVRGGVKEGVKGSKGEVSGDSKDGGKMKVVHDIDELDLITNNEMTLTLKDVSILDQVSNDEEKILLENVNLLNKGKKGYKGKKAYTPFEEEDKDEGDKGFFIDINNKQERECESDSNNNTAEDITEVTSIAFNSAKRDKLKSRNKTINWDRIFNSAEGQEQDEVINYKPKTIKKNIYNSTDDDNDDVLYKQLNRNRKITSGPVSNSSANIIDMGLNASNNDIEITDTSEFCNILKNPQRMEYKRYAEDKVDTASRTGGGISVGSTKDEVVNTDKPLGSGIMEALAYIKDRGDFIECKEPKKEDDIKLNYLDSYGKEMTPKEAFRRISWVFHGKDSGVNKRDRKYKRMERERLVRENPVHGLPTMKALFTHQQQEETPHLILTGHNNQ